MSIFDATSGRNNGSEKPAEGWMEQSVRAMERSFSENSAFSEAPPPRAGEAANSSLQSEGKLTTMNASSDGSGWDIPASGGDSPFSVAESSRAQAEMQEAPQQQAA